MSDWFYADGEETSGPVSQDRLIGFLKSVPQPNVVLVWQIGFEDWKRVDEVPELRGAIDRPPPLPSKRPAAQENSISVTPSELVTSPQPVNSSIQAEVGSRSAIVATVKSLGSALLGIVVLVGIFSFSVLFLYGSIWVSKHIIYYVFFASVSAFAACVIIFFPLALIRGTRFISVYGFFCSSFLFGLHLWLVSLVHVYNYWGLKGVIIGTLMFGVGVVPIAFLAEVLHSEWMYAAVIVGLVVLTYASRIFALWLATKIEEQRQPRDAVGTSQPVQPPQPPPFGAETQTQSEGVQIQKPISSIRTNTVWQALYNFWNPTPESRAAMQLPTFGGRFKATWKASWRWPVIWRRLVVMIVVVQLWNVGYFAVLGFQTFALERQRQAAAAAALAAVGGVQFDLLPDQSWPGAPLRTYGDGMTANRRAQGIARYCQYLTPEGLNDVEVFLSTSEEFRVLKRFRCLK
jgi:GYF domain 2